MITIAMDRQLSVIGGPVGHRAENRARPDQRRSAGDEEVLLARLVSGDVVLGEQCLDRDTLADLVHEAIEESQRTRGAAAQTTWWDAAEAANLILHHVTELASDRP